MAKVKEVRGEDVLRDLLAGRRTEVPAEGIPGVVIIYQSGAKRTHASRTSGPVVLTPERNVLVDVELEAGSGGMAIERVPFGYGPRTWRFPSPADPPPKKKAPAPAKARTLAPGDVPRTLGIPTGYSNDAET